jgi:phosphomevalonate kinase
MTQHLSAPGKVFLAGEYAVLDGGPALIAGVDRAMHASWEGVQGVHVVHRPSGVAWDGGAAPEELRFAVRAVGLALKLCEDEGLEPRGFRLVFEDDFAEDGVKLGLGGSAAACVIAVRAACAAQGRLLSEDEVVRLASEAHFTEQGQSGSGADVAACALGGLLRVCAGEIRRVAVPEDLRLLLAFTGKSASTRSLVAKVRRFMEGDAPRWAIVKGEIVAQSEALTAALEGGERQSALAAVRAGAAAMARLGEESGAPIITAELTLACALAASAGAAGKPSGAGGGDCAVVLAFGDEARDRAQRALEQNFRVFRIRPS